MESLISFDGFADVTNNLINKISNVVGWVVTHDNPKRIAIDTYINDIQNSEYDPITKAALISHAKKIVKEYCNQSDIVTKALSMITPSCDSSNIDSDWILQFMDKARLVSDSEFQLIWASILAKECNSPGVIPKSLLHILEQMDKNIAISFMKVASISINYSDNGITEYCPIVLITSKQSYYKSIGVTLDDLIELQSYGLIKMGDGFTSYSVECSKDVTVYYHDEEYTVPKIFDVGNVVYTRMGNALCSAVHADKIDEFFEKICIPLWKSIDANIKSAYNVENIEE